MDETTIPAVLLLVSVVIIGIIVFFIWAAQYFGRLAYRQFTRRQYYVPVTATVTRVHYSRPPTIYVEYQFEGTNIVNRFLSSYIAAQLAEETREIGLLIDPQFPKDVIEDRAFIAQAQQKRRPRTAEGD